MYAAARHPKFSSLQKLVNCFSMLLLTMSEAQLSFFDISEKRQLWKHISSSRSGVRQARLSPCMTLIKHCVRLSCSRIHVHLSNVEKRCSPLSNPSLTAQSACHIRCSWEPGLFQADHWSRHHQGCNQHKRTSIASSVLPVSQHAVVQGRRQQSEVMTCGSGHGLLCAECPGTPQPKGTNPAVRGRLQHSGKNEEQDMTDSAQRRMPRTRRHRAVRRRSYGAPSGWLPSTLRSPLRCSRARTPTWPHSMCDALPHYFSPLLTFLLGPRIPSFPWL